VSAHGRPGLVSPKRRDRAVRPVGRGARPRAGPRRRRGAGWSPARGTSSSRRAPRAGGRRFTDTRRDGETVHARRTASLIPPGVAQGDNAMARTRRLQDIGRQKNDPDRKRATPAVATNAASSASIRLAIRGARRVQKLDAFGRQTVTWRRRARASLRSASATVGDPCADRQGRTRRDRTGALRRFQLASDRAASIARRGRREPGRGATTPPSSENATRSAVWTRTPRDVADRRSARRRPRRVQDIEASRVGSRDPEPGGGQYDAGPLHAASRADSESVISTRPPTRDRWDAK